MLFYIDYLDHITSGSTSFNVLSLRLRYDLLIYGCDTLCMSVPACIKLGDTTELLTKLDDFWKHGKIQLQLDKKHRGNPANYFNNRKKILAKGMPEEKLINHFEFVAYESKRTDTFFRIYLPEVVAAPKDTLYLGKEKDTDALFRGETIALFEKHCDTICRSLEINRAINFTGMAERIQSFALDKSTLFQRAVVEENIIDEYKPQTEERIIIATLLDRAFALANAETSNAVPLSLVLNQLTGRWLMHLLSKTYKVLYNLICELNWKGIFTLSQDEDWRKFIAYINAYIGLVQDSKLKKYSAPIQPCINKLSHSLSLLSLLKLAKDGAIDATKNKLYEYGIFSEAQNMEITVNLLLDSYGGKYRVLLDVLRAIDLYANRVVEKLTKDKQYLYLLNHAEKQRERQYEILR
ncbi:MAG: hypothetical protein II996_00700 [Oscillospiraceae bacterium]|nr:hypothetical protein [Oscillospiraceae bacterium]